MNPVTYRKADGRDVRSAGPSALVSRLLTSFLILGCGVFGLAYLMTKSWRAAGLVAGFLFLLSVRSILLHHRDVKRLERRLSEPEPVEVMEIRATRVLDLEADDHIGPVLCFELVGGGLLILHGQWLLEHELYRAPRVVGDGNQERFNLADDPFGFPSDHFALHRWRGEMRPFWIEVLGGYLAPENSTVQLPARPKMRDMELFAGSIDSLQNDLAKAFA